MGRLVVPEEFWVLLRAGVGVSMAAGEVGVSVKTGYRWLAAAGGPAAVGFERGKGGRPDGGRISEEIRDQFWAQLRRGATISAAARAAGVSHQTGGVNRPGSVGGRC